MKSPLLIITIIITLICFMCDLVTAYNILGVFPALAHSHFSLGFKLMKELADRGHQVVFVNSHPQKNPIKNFRDISVEEIKDALEPHMDSSFLTKFESKSHYEKLQQGFYFSKSMTSAVLNHTRIKELMSSNETFDLVILEHFLNEALFFFAHKFKCPLILLSPGPAMFYNNHLFGNPAPPSFVTHIMSSYNAKMDFWQRLVNIYQEIVARLHVHFRYLPMQNEILHEIYPDAPDLNSIMYNASLLLSISHVSVIDPVPLQQNMKQVGPYFIEQPKSLPQEIQEFMDNSTEGVVVFSMGSNLKSTTFESEKRKVILKAFSKIKQKVLWKFEEDFPEKPENVKILRWLPQVDVLAHPNTKLFISHGGLLGTSEAIYHGVPILGLPIFWDQTRNIQIAVQKGLALRLDFGSLENGDTFENALEELLSNPRYGQNAKKYSAIMNDNPMKPMDLTVFWIEYVIRHQGAPHFRSAAMDLKWYQLCMLDILLVVTGVMGAVIFTALYLVLSLISKRRIFITKDKKKQ